MDSDCQVLERARKLRNNPELIYTMNKPIEVVSSMYRPVIERVTHIKWTHSERDEDRLRYLYVFEHIGEDGRAYPSHIQNWECEDVTAEFAPMDLDAMYAAAKNHWKEKHLETN